jgi:hypothetical protein
VVAVVASLDMTMTEGGAMRWHVSIGAISLIAIGLIWLPTALRVLFLAGFSLKAAGVEAMTGGLLASTDRLVSDLANLRTTTEMMAEGVSDPKSMERSVDSALNAMATRYLPTDSVLSEEVLNRQARACEEIRRTMPAGGDRTEAMTTLVNDVRIRAAAAPAAARRYASTFLRSARPGDRIVGLGLVEGAPSAEEFRDLLRIFSTSASAFEQYHSLRALNEIAPALTTEQRREAIAVLEREKTDPRGVGVMKDSYIPSWIDRVLRAMKADDARL